LVLVGVFSSYCFVFARKVEKKWLWLRSGKKFFSAWQFRVRCGICGRKKCREQRAFSLGQVLLLLVNSLALKNTVAGSSVGTFSRVAIAFSCSNNLCVAG
jgi:hypothetical protein